MKSIEAVDPSKSVIIAAKMLAKFSNIRITQASVESLPFSDGSFDLVVSLGVLHHIPKTEEALQVCVNQVKPGGACLIYLYYNLDNRGFIYKVIFQTSAMIRKIISRLPGRIKRPVCDAIAYLIYWPLSRFGGLLKTIVAIQLSQKIPLNYYYDKSIHILRNDSLDRFGTSLEQRFSRSAIKDMMANCGLERVRFSTKAPYWHVLGYKPQNS